MNKPYKIFRQEQKRLIKNWGIKEIPFTESDYVLLQSKLDQVFTGRDKELQQAIRLFLGKGRKRILVYGWIGIGKTAFIKQLIKILNRESQKTLTAYISLDPNIDIATCSFIALAREMKHDRWAQEQLNQMGISPSKTVRRRSTTLSSKIPIGGGEIKNEPIPAGSIQYPSYSFSSLLERAMKRYSKVIIAIDDLDKQDPDKIRKLLHDAQGILKGNASFILTGHPTGLTRDLLTTERGMFDLVLELKQIDQDTMYEMLENYLDNVRPIFKHYKHKDPNAVKPFTPETAKIFCKQSDGVPRYFNRLGTYVMQKALELDAPKITTEILTQGLIYTDEVLRKEQGLTANDYYILDLVLEKDILSDENITLEELEKIKVKEFREILPILEKLVQKDLIRRLPSEHAAEYQISPLLKKG